MTQTNRSIGDDPGSMAAAVRTAAVRTAAAPTASASPFSGAAGATRSLGGSALEDYLRLIARMPLLTPSEELHLGAVVQEWLRHPSPSAGLRRRGIRARNRMITGNLRLVVMVWRGHQRRSGRLPVDPLDLLQAGNLGLIRAVERFDPSRGYRLSTYAVWWIQAAFREFAAEFGSGIRIPSVLRNLAHRAEQLRSASGQSLTTGEIAERLGEKPERLEAVLTILRQCRTTSLDRPAAGRSPAGRSEETNLIDRIRDERSLTLQDDYGWLQQHLLALEWNEQRVLRLRYGEDGSCSYLRAGQLMGLSKGSVQSLERRALRTLRRRMAAAGPARSASGRRAINCPAAASGLQTARA